MAGAPIHASHQPPRLTLPETLHLLFILLDSTRLKLQSRILTLLSAPSSSSPIPAVAAASASLRRILSSLSIRQLQSALPTSSSTYRAFCRSHGVAPAIDDLGVDEQGQWNGAVMWVGGKPEPTKQKKVLFYCHGGGYVVAMGRGHFEQVRGVVEEGKGEVVAAVLEYGVAPQTEFPGPLRQAVAALKYLFGLGYRAEDIVLSGDSAGGHLALSILSHLLHPHPAVEVLELPAKGRFPAAVLISPWVSFETTASSFATNAEHDYISDTFIGMWAWTAIPWEIRQKEVMAGRYHNEPAKAPGEWWRGLDRVVGRVEVLVGGKEVFRDDIVDWA
ncbi:alpha/beta-hydrolase, partial [Ascodesmis nigricans]